jgi:tRNA(fMet)-specific endonuclease VapC
MKYVLDTNSVSAVMKGLAPMIDRLAAVARKDVMVPQPVLAEIAYGIERLPRSRRRDQIAALFESIRTTFSSAAWDDAVTYCFATVKAGLGARGERIEDLDIAVAAHALALDAVLVTANRSHMSRVPGLRIEDWAT